MTRDGGAPQGSPQHGVTSRRAFLGLGALGVTGAVVACSSNSAPPSVAATATTRTSAGRRVVPENSLPGDWNWEIRHLGPADAIEGYTGAASVLTGEPFQLFVSTTSSGFGVKAFRLGWYGGAGARQVWQSGRLRGHRQNAPGLTGSTSTVHTDWDPAIEVPTDDWPAGAYLLRLDADSGAQRYVPVTIRSAGTQGKVVLKNCVATWQAYNTWGGYDLYIGPGQSYADRSLAVSLDRPYDLNGADMFLTYERNAVKL
ncbi:MAG TPA: N,N-dimethylformamidase beta subunit family domain-containing protein, partial [Streptosporangiaceae bacterium]|nr:N,N-dimethylformamidase beta subunit family domain-containing protein [Streptosporangiaceae bacterium]